MNMFVATHTHIALSIVLCSLKFFAFSIKGIPSLKLYIYVMVSLGNAHPYLESWSLILNRS